MEWHRVASLAELTAGGGRQIVRLGNQEVGLFLLGGNCRAYLNRCPHAGAPICSGPVLREDEPHARLYAPDEALPTEGDLTLRCPWHAWDFSLADGTHRRNPDIQLDAFAVEIRDGEIFLGTTLPAAGR